MQITSIGLPSHRAMFCSIHMSQLRPAQFLAVRALSLSASDQPVYLSLSLYLSVPPSSRIVPAMLRLTEFWRRSSELLKEARSIGVNRIGQRASSPFFFPLIVGTRRVVVNCFNACLTHTRSIRYAPECGFCSVF